MMVFGTIAALVLGVICGLAGLEHGLVSWLEAHTDLILYLLMFSVGISVGMYRGIVKKIREYHIRVFLIPLGITAGSLLGGVLGALLLGMPWRQGAAVAGGMGWYSLAGVTIGNLGGARLGSIAFLSNLMREIFSFLLIPLIARRLNGYTCIAPAGATSEDTTLPMILKYTDERIVVLSVINGVVCSLLVPVIISACFPAGI